MFSAHTSFEICVCFAVNRTLHWDHVTFLYTQNDAWHTLHNTNIRHEIWLTLMPRFQREGETKYTSPWNLQLFSVLLQNSWGGDMCRAFSSIRGKNRRAEKVCVDHDEILKSCFKCCLYLQTWEVLSASRPNMHQLSLTNIIPYFLWDNRSVSRDFSI